MALGLPSQLHGAVLAGEQGARNIWEVTHLQQPGGRQLMAGS